MHCRTCGAEVAENAEICLKCGAKPLVGVRFCQNCGAETIATQEICVKCGVRLVGGAGAGEKDWLTALLLSIFLGYFGVDRFYMGYIGLGILKLLTCCVPVWWIIDVIMIATNSLKDAKGRPLKKNQ